MARRKQKNTSPLRALRDLRCSTDEQGEGEYTTLDVQDADTKRYVAEKGNIDCGCVRSTVTGTTLNRSDWKTAYAMAQAGEIDVVVTTFRSRLGRGPAGLSSIPSKVRLSSTLLSGCGIRGRSRASTSTSTESPMSSGARLRRRPSCGTKATAVSTRLGRSERRTGCPSSSSAHCSRRCRKSWTGSRPGTAWTAPRFARTTPTTCTSGSIARSASASKRTAQRKAARFATTFATATIKSGRSARSSG